MKKWKTKRMVFLFGSDGIFALVSLLFLFGGRWCYEGSTCESIEYRISENFQVAFYFLFPLFLFSLLTYKLRDEIFLAWWRFTRWFVPIAIILTLITPHDHGGGWGIPSLLDPEFVGIVFAFLFAAISVVIIAWKIIAVYYLKKGVRK